VVSLLLFGTKNIMSSIDSIVAPGLAGEISRGMPLKQLPFVATTKALDYHYFSVISEYLMQKMLKVDFRLVGGTLLPLVRHALLLLVLFVYIAER
jgi:hypothetical protein